jgi:hypothetical protein
LGIERPPSSNIFRRPSTGLLESPLSQASSMSRQQSLQALVDSVKLGGSLDISTLVQHKLIKSSTGPLPVYDDKTKKNGQPSFSRLSRQEINADNLLNSIKERGDDLLLSATAESLREEGTKDGAVSNLMPVQDQTMAMVRVFSEPLGSIESSPQDNGRSHTMIDIGNPPKFDSVTIKMAASKRQAALRLPQAPPGGFFYATLPALEEEAEPPSSADR